MWNEKDFDSGIRSKENMVMILVRKGSAAMRELRKSYANPDVSLMLDWEVSTWST